MQKEQRRKVSPQLLEQLRRVGTGSACSALDHLGLRPTFMYGIRPIVGPRPGARVAGQAVTARFLPWRKDIWEAMPEEERSVPPYRHAIEELEPGDVLVLDQMGRLEGASIGDILAARIKARGGVGVVIDGAVRDQWGMDEVGLPVFARGLDPVPCPYYVINTDANVPIQCGGVLVMPGDIILADSDGVVVIPPPLAPEVAKAGIEREELEAFIRVKVEKGASTLGFYPPSDETRREYEAYRASKR